MKLWLLKRPEGASPLYDTNWGFVIRAKSEKAAREMASAIPGDENRYSWEGSRRIIVDSPWLHSEQTTCVPLAARGETEIVLRDFNAG
jgi:hypothetical protein